MFGEVKNGYGTFGEVKNASATYIAKTVDELKNLLS